MVETELLESLLIFLKEIGANMENNEIMVSVICTTYNHEKYIRQCLEGFLMQRTNFKFEVIVHDDASTDKTADIIREYEKKYSEIIKPIYQTENQYSKGADFGKIIYSKCNGKYFATCEGDDFWVDEYKLQKQVDALESNPNCKLCVTRVQCVDEDGSNFDRKYPSFDLKTGVLTTDKSLKIICHEYAFQTSSYFKRREEFMLYNNNPPEYKKIAVVGDYPQLLYFASNYDVYYIDDITSCYRKNSIGSFSYEIHKANKEKTKKFYLNMVLMMEEFDKEINYKYHNYCKTFEFIGYLYHIYILEKNYKEVLKKRYRYFFNQESFKDRLFIKTSVYLPFFAKIYSKIKK